MHCLHWSKLPLCTVVFLCSSSIRTSCCHGHPWSPGSWKQQPFLILVTYFAYLTSEMSNIASMQFSYACMIFSKMKECRQSCGLFSFISRRVPLIYHRCFLDLPMISAHQELVLTLACGHSWALHLGSSGYGISWAGAVWINESMRDLLWICRWNPWFQALALSWQWFRVERMAAGKEHLGFGIYMDILICRIVESGTGALYSYAISTAWSHCLNHSFKRFQKQLRLLPFCSQNKRQRNSSLLYILSHNNVRFRVGNKTISIRVTFVNVLIAESTYDEVFLLAQAKKSGDETTLLRCWRFRVEKSEKSQVLCSTLLSVSKSELMASDQRRFFDRWSSSINIREEWPFPGQHMAVAGFKIWFLPVPYSIPSFKGDVDSRDLNIFAPLVEKSTLRPTLGLNWNSTVWEVPNEIAIPGDWRPIFRQGRSLQSPQWALEMHPEGFGMLHHGPFLFGISGTCWNSMFKLYTVYTNIWYIYMVYNI